MKKILWALCAVLMLSMSACKKDNVEPTNPSGNGNGNGTEQPVQIPTGEGYYNPAQHITRIVVDDETSEEWLWTNHVLTTIMTAADEGALEETQWFEYDNYRVKSMDTYIQGMPVTVNYTYSGDKLAAVSATNGSTEVLNVVFTHNSNGKVSQLTMNINPDLLSMLSELFGNGFPMFKGKNASKFSINNTAISASLSWQGDNVSRVLLTAEVNGSVSLSEIRQFVNLDSIANDYVSMLNILRDTSAIPITLTLNDTADYTYDSQHNPLYGFLGALDPTIFSANNATSTANSSGAKLTITLDFVYFTVPFTQSYPLGTTTETYTYTYNAAGFPETATSSEGSTKQYIYQEQQQ